MKQYEEVDNSGRGAGGMQAQNATKGEKLSYKNKQKQTLTYKYIVSTKWLYTKVCCR